MIKNLSAIGIVFLLVSCGNSGLSEKKDSALQASTKTKPAEKPVADKIIASNEKAVITEIQRPHLLLFGKNLKTSSQNLIKDIKAELPLLLAQLNNHGGIMTGPLTYIYLKLPQQNNIELFVGMPIKNEFKGAEMGEFMELGQSAYYKMQCDCEPGETLATHAEMQAMLKKANKEFSLPILEIFNESRNDVMAPVSKATILYPVKQNLP